MKACCLFSQQGIVIDRYLSVTMVTPIIQVSKLNLN